MVTAIVNFKNSENKNRWKQESIVLLLLLTIFFYGWRFFFFFQLTLLVELMRKNNSLFNDLYLKEHFAGSYPDGLKIGKPTEYDMNLIIKLPVDFNKLKVSMSKIFSSKKNVVAIIYLIYILTDKNSSLNLGALHLWKLMEKKCFPQLSLFQSLSMFIKVTYSSMNFLLILE